MKKASSVVKELNQDNLTDLKQLPSLNFNLCVESSCGLLASVASSWRVECLRFERVEQVHGGLTLWFSIKDTSAHFCLRRDMNKMVSSWIEPGGKTFSYMFSNYIARNVLFIKLPVFHTSEEYNAKHKKEPDGTLSWTWPVRRGEPHDECSILQVGIRPNGTQYGAGLFDYNWLALPDWETDWHLKVLHQSGK